MATTSIGSSGITYPNGATNGGYINSSTAVASTSGTSIDFTSIPSWVKRITVMLKGVSTSGSGVFITQLGAGSVTTTGYLSSGWGWSGGTNGLATTVGLIFQGQTPNSGTVYNSVMTINSLGSNAWVSQAIIASTTGQVDKYASTGGITLGGTLDRIRITTTAGSDTFTAGSINILYE